MRACLHMSADQILKIIIEDSNAREEEGVKRINTVSGLTHANHREWKEEPASVNKMHLYLLLQGTKGKLSHHLMVTWLFILVEILEVVT